jgi:hypothetical protein
MKFNIMMDASPLYSTTPHPLKLKMKRDWSGPISHRSRTERPVKYYFTDFGISRQYKPEDFPVLESPIIGGNKTVPEFQIKIVEIPRIAIRSPQTCTILGTSSDKTSYR